MTILASLSIKIEERSRLFLGFGEVQTLQSHPTVGIPREVPVPKKITRIRALSLWFFHKLHAQFIENILQQVGFLSRQVALGLFL